MKRNVDLTDNMMFSHHIRTKLHKRANIFSDNYFWKFQEHIISPEDEVIFTGNKKNRAFKKDFWENMNCDATCDCCGKSLIHFPWNKKYCLCDECENRLKNSLGKNNKKLWENL